MDINSWLLEQARASASKPHTGQFSCNYLYIYLAYIVPYVFWCCNLMWWLGAACRL